ncbi:O-antigen ligase family protein [Lactiplantibacillus fabifermentans]|nr:O-antigen ligase family protein [Lactiplantibacillus fabifermentans]
MTMDNRQLSTTKFLNGLKLLAVLPPVGIGWLIYLSRWQWLKLFKRPKTIAHDMMLAFILLLMVVTGLNLNHHDWKSVLLSMLMLFVLMNLWLLCRQSAHVITLADVRQFIIQFGLYIMVSGNLFHWLNHWLNFPNWLKFLLGDLLWGYAANKNRLFGSAYNPNDACCLMLIALGLLLVQLTTHATTKIATTSMQWTQWGWAALLMLGIYQTKSRTGLAIMVLMILWASYMLNWRHGLVVTSLLGAAGMLLLIYLPRSHSWLASWQGRTEIWKNSWALFKNAPLFGVTYYGFAEQYLKLTGTSVPHAHDIFLMLLASFGILGGVGFLMLIVGGGWSMKQIWQSPQRHPNLRYFAMTLPIILAYGLTDFVLSSMQVLIVILLIIAYWHHEQHAQPQLALARKKEIHHF